MQEYVAERNLNPTILKTAHPNINKVFLKSLVYASGIIACIIVILIYLNNEVGLDIFMTVFETLGINIEPGSILIITILIALGITIVFLASKYLGIVNQRYEFYDNHLTIYEPTALVLLTHKDISYRNIVKISFNYEGFMNKLLNSGDITIDVTGMEDASVRMEVIDDARGLAEQLLRIVNEYRSLQQMQFEENRRIDGIMHRF
jgi:hypothetical protein